MNYHMRIESQNVAEITIDELKKRRVKIGFAFGIHFRQDNDPAPNRAIVEVILAGIELIDLMVAWVSCEDHARVINASPRLCRFIDAGRGDAMVEAFGRASRAGGAVLKLPMVRSAWMDVAQMIVTTLGSCRDDPGSGDRNILDLRGADAGIVRIADKGAGAGLTGDALQTDA